MEYVGADHYFFWLGVEKGRGSSVRALPGWLEGMCPIDNKTSERCREAFSWGFCFGLVTEVEEFVSSEPETVDNLMETISESNIEEQEDMMYDDLEKEVNYYPPKGNC